MLQLRLPAVHRLHEDVLVVSSTYIIYRVYAAKTQLFPNGSVAIFSPVVLVQTYDVIGRVGGPLLNWMFFRIMERHG